MEVLRHALPISAASNATRVREMILGGGELLRATILLGLPSVLFSYGDGVDIMEWMCPPVAPKGLEAEGQDLYCWAESLGASATKCRRIVGLLNVRWMSHSRFRGTRTG
jgi:hypothetical protein